jgi:hypothetical protein
LVKEMGEIVRNWNPENKSYDEMAPWEKVENNVWAARYERLCLRLIDAGS